MQRRWLSVSCQRSDHRPRPAPGDQSRGPQRAACLDVALRPTASRLRRATRSRSGRGCRPRRSPRKSLWRRRDRPRPTGSRCCPSPRRRPVERVGAARVCGGFQVNGGSRPRWVPAPFWERQPAGAAVSAGSPGDRQAGHGWGSGDQGQGASVVGSAAAAPATAGSSQVSRIVSPPWVAAACPVLVAPAARISHRFAEVSPRASSSHDEVAGRAAPSPGSGRVTSRHPSMIPAACRTWRGRDRAPGGVGDVPDRQRAVVAPWRRAWQRTIRYRLDVSPAGMIWVAVVARTPAPRCRR